ncbi:MAG TPA: mechanosensitive ion channel domain-containing protein, partial [Tahibacter sp.]|nr:mechanosensitive ion channel domain-containing protein [Tahibacter sp.]
SRATQRLADVRAQHDDYAKNRVATEQALKNTQERVKIGGVTEAVGLILLAEREKLQPAAALKRKLAALQTELAQAKIRLIDLRELGTSLDDPAARVDARMKELPPGADHTPALRQALFRVFGARAEVVAQLALAQRSLADALADAEQELKSLTEATAQLRDILNAHLLWTPSHAPVDREWPVAIASGAIDAFRPSRWWEAGKLAVDLALARPASTLAGIALVVALLVFRRRMPARLEAISAPMRRIRTDRYRFTGEAFALSLVATLPLPLALWLLSRLLQRAGDAGYVFTDALGLSLAGMVPTVAMLSFMRWLTADKGLAATHFRWNPNRRQALDRIRRWLSYGLVPVVFLLLLYFNYGEQFTNAGFARFVFIVGCLALARLVWQMLAPGVLWSSRAVEPVRTRQVLRLGVTGALVGLVVLALAGYVLTAVTLAGRFVESGSAFLALATLNGMALRWLSLGERRLALKRMEEKREADGARSDDAELEMRPEFAAEAEQITLASINQQTRRLLRALTTVVLAATLLWVWSDVSPALSYLGNVDAWKSSYVSDGRTVEVTVNLRSLLFAVVALMLTWIATRNLPGLLEIGVLRRLNVDAPTRYAITAIARYAIAIFGTVFGLSLFGLRWGQLQWMAAALTVGLGFGLQEIFANFVSGLIVLFERPIRVGDVISIGGIEGTVTRIRTRATTVVDWDNREVVIPNKTFITSQLTNWTLTDAVTRVVIKVGVSYDSDPEAVRLLLLEIARAHPKVLKEPGPNCWCVALADSTLNFELRVFVGDTLERNAVRNDLHGTILREFRERKVDIAFPQMDVWVHRAPALAAPDALKQD